MTRVETPGEQECLTSVREARDEARLTDGGYGMTSIADPGTTVAANLYAGLPAVAVVGGVCLVRGQRLEAPEVLGVQSGPVPHRVEK